MNTKHNLTSLLCALALLAATASSHAAAIPMTLNYSGTFGTTTTLGGTAFGANTPFSFAATFNSAAPLGGLPNGWQKFSATSFTILINSTTYTATTPSALNVLLVDTTSPSGYLAGLVDTAHGSMMGSTFSGATPTLNADTPAPTVFSDFSNSDLTVDFQIALNGVTGGLAVNDLVNDLVDPAAASLSLSAVPEPSEWTAISFAVIGLAYAAKRRLTKAAH